MHTSCASWREDSFLATCRPIRPLAPVNKIEHLLIYSPKLFDGNAIVLLFIMREEVVHCFLCLPQIKVRQLTLQESRTQRTLTTSLRIPPGSQLARTPP